MGSDNVGVHRKGNHLCPLVAGFFSFFIAISAFSQGTAFTYQGRLSDGGAGANGNYDVRFTVYNAVTNGAAVSGAITNFNIPVSNGLFTTTVDFGAGIFTGPNLWLDIGVRTNGGTNFAILSPRQAILPVPYAIFANSAGNLTGLLPASQLSGTLPASAFQGYTNTVALTNGANLFSGAFSGNGAAVTNVNVTNLTGVLADSQLPNNTAFLNSNQTFTASNTFNGANTFTNLRGNSFSGSFFGNGLVGWVVVAGTSQQASIDTGYLLTNSQVVTVTLPASVAPGDIVRIAGAGTTGWRVAQNANQSIVGSFSTFGKSWLPSDANALNWKAISSSADGTKMAAVYSGASGDGVALSTDSGQVWSFSGPSIGETWQAVASSPDGTAIVVAPDDNSIYSSTNSGATWVNNVTSDLDWTGVATTGAAGRFVAVAYGSYIFINSGTTWTATFGPGYWTCVALATGGSELVAADSGTGIYASSNGGTNWSEIYSGSPAWSAVAASADGSRLIAAASSGGVYLSSNSGGTFTEVTSLPTSANWSSVACSADGSKLVAAVNGGSIYTSIDWGSTWQTNGLNANWSAVVYPADGNTAAAAINNYSATGSPPGIYTSQNGSEQSTTAGTSGYLSGGQDTAVELQYIGNNEFMPVSSYGTLWGN